MTFQDSQDPVRSYFDAVADSYAHASARFPWSLTRQRELAAVRHLLGDLKGRSVLDLGCGAGFYSRMAAELGASEVMSVDISPSMLKALPPNCEGLCADAVNVNPGRQFSIILCAGLLEFVPAPEKIVFNARRLVGRGGKLVVLAPNVGWAGFLYKLYHRTNGNDVRLFGHSGLRKLASVSGWRVEECFTASPLAVAQRWTLQ